MHKFHSEILHELQQISGLKNPAHLGSNYSGSSHPRYGITNPQTHQLFKEWLAFHKDLSEADFQELVDSFYHGESTDEKKLGGYLLAAFPNYRHNIHIADVKDWLLQLEGWEEIDGLCQSNFTEKDILANWEEWSSGLAAFASSDNVNLQRASLVLLTKPCAHCIDERLISLALANIDKLKLHKEILVTKAISWLLRDISRSNKQVIQEYLDRNKDTLPKIAVREVSRKLATGKK